MANTTCPDGLRRVSEHPWNRRVSDFLEALLLPDSPSETRKVPVRQTADVGKPRVRIRRRS